VTLNFHLFYIKLNRIGGYPKFLMSINFTKNGVTQISTQAVLEDLLCDFFSSRHGARVHAHRSSHNSSREPCTSPSRLNSRSTPMLQVNGFVMDTYVYTTWWKLLFCPNTYSFPGLFIFHFSYVADFHNALHYSFFLGINGFRERTDVNMAYQIFHPKYDHGNHEDWYLNFRDSTSG
jgi:hypothetical protein